MNANACEEFTDSTGVTHSLYRNSNPDTIGELQNALSSRTVLIADGHHRYETALSYAAAHPDPRNGYVMLSLVSMADPGLVILPFHRLVRVGFGSVSGNLMDALAKFFVVRELGKGSLDMIYSLLKGPPDSGMLFLNPQSGTMYSLTLNAEGQHYLETHSRGMSAHWNNLDVSIINSIFINAILGLPLDPAILHDAVEYINTPATALSKASPAAEYRGAFFIRPVDIPAIKRIVDLGERMPQKSTNFFPKCFSGLVFNSLEDA
jgi:uncharacterized protein (DUF1015 family)